MGVFVTIAVLLGVFGIGGFALSNSGAFAVEQVTVSGADHLSGDELTELAAVPAGSTLLNVDANGIATRLAANPWVKSVSVDRVFPNTLNLNITERSISAVVAVTVDSSNTVERWALSSDGMWLTKIPDDRNSAEGKALPDSVHRILNHVCISVNRMLRLIDQMLDFNQLETDELRLRVVGVDAAKELRQQVASFEESARVKGIKLELVIKHGNYRMWLDGDKVEKIMGNLFTNALKHTSPGGVIRISAHVDDDILVVSVFNSGKLIAEDRMQDVFKR